MLQLNVVVEPEKYDEETGLFIDPKTRTIQLEHSLVSLSKWESKWHKSFLHSDKTNEETLDYIRCMTVTQNVPPEVYANLSPKNISEIEAYIDNPMTGTTFSKENDKKHKKENGSFHYSGDDDGNNGFCCK